MPDGPGIFFRAGFCVRLILRVPVQSADTKPEDVRGGEIHQSNPSGVCRKCIQGLDNNIVKPGVLKQLSLKYPNLRIEVTSEVLPNVKVSGKSNFVMMNGKYIQ